MYSHPNGKATRKNARGHGFEPPRAAFCNFPYFFHLFCCFCSVGFWTLGLVFFLLTSCLLFACSTPGAIFISFIYFIFHFILLNIFFLILKIIKNIKMINLYFGFFYFYFSHIKYFYLVIYYLFY